MSIGDIIFYTSIIVLYLNSLGVIAVYLTQRIFYSFNPGRYYNRITSVMVISLTLSFITTILLSIY